MAYDRMQTEFMALEQAQTYVRKLKMTQDQLVEDNNILNNKLRIAQKMLRESEVDKSKQSKRNLQLQKELTSLRAENEKHCEELYKRTKAISELKARLHKQSETMDEKNLTIERLEKEIKGMEEDGFKHQRIIKEQYTKIAQILKGNENLTLEMKEHIIQIEQMIRDQDEKHGNLLKGFDDRQAKLVSQQAKLDSQQAKLDSQQAKLDSQQTKLDSQQETIQHQLNMLLQFNQNKGNTNRVPGKQPNVHPQSMPLLEEKKRERSPDKVKDRLPWLPASRKIHYKK